VDDICLSVTAIVSETLTVPVSVTVIVAVTIPLDGSRALELRVAVRIPDPFPDGGDTVSHGWFDEVVQVTAPVPACVRRTVCAGVCAVSTPAFVTAPKFRVDGVDDIVGRVDTTWTYSSREPEPR
jgi:hypothetical protein